MHANWFAMKFTLEQLEKTSKSRPQGYREDVLQLATKIDDNLYELSEDNFKTLAEKYRLPSILEMIKNTANAASDALKKGRDVRSPEEIQRILSICGTCQFFILESKRCGACGCFLQAKTLFKSWHCPKNKW
jgi:hypothetical protein